MTQDCTDQGKARPLDGRYANYFEIGYNEFEFVIDFGQYYQSEKKQLHSRIVLPPSYAKNLSEVLQTSIRVYERTFGDIAPVDK